MVIPEGVEGEPHHGRVDVDIVGDEFHLRAPFQRRNDGAGLPVGDAGHGVVQVGHVGRACVKGGVGGVVAGAGVGNGDPHLVMAGGNELQRTRLLRGDIHQLDQAVCPLLQAAEHCNIRLVEILRVLGTHLVGADEGALHVDAHKVCASAVLMGSGGIHHTVQDLFRESHGGGADGQHALTGLKIGQGLDGFFIAVTEILAHGTVEVDIHQARQSVSALGIHDLFAFLRLCKGHDTPLPDGQAPLLKGVAGGINQSIFDDHILILTLSFVQPLSRACARQLPL